MRWRGHAMQTLAPQRDWFVLLILALRPRLFRHRLHRHCRHSQPPLYQPYVEAEDNALLTAPFLLPEPDAFLGAAAGAALFPLPVATFFPNDGWPVSEPKSLPCTSTSIVIESTDSASSLLVSERALAFPLFSSRSVCSENG